jgi:ribosome assembly protein 3
VSRAAYMQRYARVLTSEVALSSSEESDGGVEEGEKEVCGVGVRGAFALLTERQVVTTTTTTAVRRTTTTSSPSPAPTKKPKKAKKSKTRTIDSTSTPAQAQHEDEDGDEHMHDAAPTTTPSSKPTSTSSKPPSKIAPQPPPTNLPLSDAKVAEQFAAIYLRKITAELGDDLDKVRVAQDFNANSIPMLVKALRQGSSVFGTEEKRRVVAAAGS